MSGILILGAGGHAKVVADILIQQGMPVRGYLDDNQALWGEQSLGLPIMGGIDSYRDYVLDGLIIGVGLNRARQAIVDRLGGPAAHLWINAVHPSAVLTSSVRLGKGIVVAAGAILNPDTAIADHVIINTGATVDHDCVLGAGCHVAPGANLAGGVQVGDGALIGLGAAVTPLCKVGAWAVIGAGAVVVCDIPGGVTAKGIPARWDTR